MKGEEEQDGRQKEDKRILRPYFLIPLVAPRIQVVSVGRTSEPSAYTHHVQSHRVSRVACCLFYLSLSPVATAALFWYLKYITVYIRKRNYQHYSILLHSIRGRQLFPHPTHERRKNWTEFLCVMFNSFLIPFSFRYLILDGATPSVSWVSSAPELITQSVRVRVRLRERYIASPIESHIPLRLFFPPRCTKKLCFFSSPTLTLYWIRLTQLFPSNLYTFLS